MKSPKISVIIPSYNHSRFIVETIKSVLWQTFQDFEIVITDDGSTDDSVEVIKQISDPRIKCFPLAKNVGAAEAMNHCIRNSAGEYIAVINSDDRWIADKLHLQFDFLEKNASYGAVFSDVDFINEKGDDLRAPGSWAGIFAQDNRSQGEWLRRFFFHGNCLCHPSVLIRRSVYNSVGLYENRFRQLPDFEMWIRVVKKFPIFVMADRLVQFRLLDHEQNASSPAPKNKVRLRNELFFIMKNFFSGCSPQILLEGFASEIQRPDLQTADEVFCEAALIMVNQPSICQPVTKLIGLELLFQGLRNENVQRILASHYGMDDLKFYDFASRVETFYALPPPLESIHTKDLMIYSALRTLRSIRNRLNV